MVCPYKLCVNVWGDAAIGFTGMDFETAVRERIPILSMLLNNFSMAVELKMMPASTEKYRATDISGDYAAMARAFGGHGERVTEVADIILATQRGIEQTQNGVPALLEFITAKETRVSRLWDYPATAIRITAGTTMNTAATTRGVIFSRRKIVILKASVKIGEAATTGTT